MESTTSDDWEPFWDEGYSDTYGPWIQSTEEHGFDPCPRCGKRPMLAFERSPFAASCPRGCPHPLFVRGLWVSCLMYGEDLAKHELRWIWHQEVLISTKYLHEEPEREQDGLP